MASRLRNGLCRADPGGYRPEPGEFLALPGPHFPVCPAAPSRWLGFRQSKFEKVPKILRQLIARVSYQVPPKTSCDSCLVPYLQRCLDTARSRLRSKTESLREQAQGIPFGHMVLN